MYLRTQELVLVKRKLILKKSNFASVFVLVEGRNSFLPSVVLRSVEGAS